MRALVIAHGHPDAGIGGGELAAHNLFRGLQRHADVEAAWFLARTGDRDPPPGAIVAGGREREFLWRRDTLDWFHHRGDADSLGPFRMFLRETAPDAVFVHHFAHVGIEVFAEIRRVLPASKIVATLHDFAAICHNAGLMAKTGFARAPCERATPAACHACFPAIAAASFAERRAELREALASVNRFVSPSAFLKNRYVEWGIASERIAVVENGLEPMRAAPRPASDGTFRLGFFGQVREAKGLDVLLAALHLLSPAERRGFLLDVNGSRLEAQSAWYRELVSRLRAPLEAEGVLEWRGGYARAELVGRMAGLDFVVVPSTWWENAPIVVQEAFAHGVPVIGSDHGGIAEKVRDGVDGLLFAPRDPRALAALLRSLLADPKRRDALARAIRPQPGFDAMAADYVRLCETRSTPENGERGVSPCARRATPAALPGWTPSAEPPRGAAPRRA